MTTSGCAGWGFYHEMSRLRRQRMVLMWTEQQQQPSCAGEHRRASHYESVSAQGAALSKRDSQTLEVPHSHPCSVSIQLSFRWERKHAFHAALRGGDGDDYNTVVAESVKAMVVIYWGEMESLVTLSQIVEKHLNTDAHLLCTLMKSWSAYFFCNIVCQYCTAYTTGVFWCHILYVIKMHLA